MIAFLKALKFDEKTFETKSCHGKWLNGIQKNKHLKILIFIVS